jgi:hypothetical protein
MDAAATVEPVMLTGRTCRVEPLGEGNLDAVYDAVCVQSPPETWTYITGGPYEDRNGFAGHVAGLHALAACVPLAILAAEGQAAEGQAAAHRGSASPATCGSTRPTAQRRSAGS